MIVLGNPEFATAMKLVGIKESFAVRQKEDILNYLKTVNPEEFILANVSVMKLVPELDKFKNVVSIPDDPEKFRTTQDLKNIIRSAVGIDINI